METKLNKLLEFRSVTKEYPIKKNFFGKVTKILRAVDKVSFSVHEGKTVGIVGESGCGKTTIGRLLLNLIRPTEGSIRYKDKKLSNMSKAELKIYRNNVQAVFQNPLSSLNPRMTVEQIVGEPIFVENKLGKKKAKEKIANCLEICGMNSGHMQRYPHQFSGGQRQRIAIARAISTDAKILLLDEPVSSLDVSVRAQIVNLFKDLQKKFDMSFVFIAHDLVLVHYVSHYILVVYLGRVVEYGASNEVFFNALHPYTKLLLKGMLLPDPNFEMPYIEEGDPLEKGTIKNGCLFATRCKDAVEKCYKVAPSMIKVGSEHFSACHTINKNII